MAPIATVRNLKIWISSISGKPSGAEDELIAVVRRRLNAKVSNMDTPVIGAALLAYGLEPLLRYMEVCLPGVKFKTLSNEALADHIHDGFRVVATRTRLVKKFADALDSAKTWELVTASLGRARLGEELTAPGGLDDSSGAAMMWMPPSEPVPPRWAGRRTICVALFSSATLIY